MQDSACCAQRHSVDVNVLGQHFSCAIWSNLSKMLSPELLRFFSKSLLPLGRKVCKYLAGRGSWKHAPGQGCVALFSLCQSYISFPSRTCLLQIRTLHAWFWSRFIKSSRPAPASYHTCTMYQTWLDLELLTIILCKRGISHQLCQSVFTCAC